MKLVSELSEAALLSIYWIVFQFLNCWGTNGILQPRANRFGGHNGPLFLRLDTTLPIWISVYLLLLRKIFYRMWWHQNHPSSDTQSDRMPGRQWNINEKQTTDTEMKRKTPLAWRTRYWKNSEVNLIIRKFIQAERQTLSRTESIQWPYQPTSPSVE